MRTTKWLFRPDDNMILAEFEHVGKQNGLHDLSDDEFRRLDALGIRVESATGFSSGRHDETQNP